ncbi:protein FATTY ACID EXPORT 2, chloroplastic [Euphorbia lathyris]|uniref:protein FATTY ACID EXPORT 2, chloroplastic n=1 Tax=Euphorbia lathyris TaxID=212925 RepID=UPI00331346E7
MAESLVGVVSQSSLLSLEPSRFGFRTNASVSSTVRIRGSSSGKCSYRRFAVSSGNHLRPLLTARVVSSDFIESALITDSVNLSSEGIEIQLDSGGGGGYYGDIGGGEGGGGGGGDNSGGRGGGGDPKNEGEGGSSDDSGGEKKKMALSMSQKLTLGYAALVGFGGFMGYMKSGSQKSLLAGGLSASILYYVHTQLPTNPVYASSIGLGVSSVLLGVMGSRFLRSKKIMPAGVVSLVSLIMTGGYIHGVMRSLH